MTFAVPADAYDRLVGRYSYDLSDALAGAAGIGPDTRVLDVGAGTGVGTRRLVELAGADRVTAVEPSPPFVEALRHRFPGVDVRQASAESLPFDDDVFDAALAQLVFNFTADPDAGVAELRRVTRPGGVVAACVWDYVEEMTLLRVFWDAATALDPQRAAGANEATQMSFARDGELAELWRRAGLRDVSQGALVVSVAYESFDEVWDPFTAGVAPSGAYTASLDDEGRAALRAEYRRRLGEPEGGLELSARAWYAVGKA